MKSYRSTRLAALAITLIAALAIGAETAPTETQDNSVLRGRGTTMMREFLIAKVKHAAARPLPKTKEEFEASLPQRRAELLRCLGLDPMPPKTPLNAEVTGVIQRDGYRIEKVVFYSRPGFPVTGHLYVPSTGGPKFPVIVNVNGHYKYKKAEPREQPRFISEVKHGYIVFAIDSPGFANNNGYPAERQWQGTHHDLYLTVGSADTTSLYVWDCIRAADYLETRPDVDAGKMAITGVSGGGLCTMYAFAVEPRFKVGVPVCYAVSMEIAANNGCRCNHVPGVLQLGDRADVMAIRAAPLYVIGATDDKEFPPEGTLLTGKKLHEIWDLYGAAGDTKAVVFPGGHAYSQEMRESSLGWFDKYLKGAANDNPVPETASKIEDENDPNLLCLPNPPAGLKTMRDIAKENLKTATPKTFEQVVALNGGIPQRAPLNFKVVAKADDKTYVTFESEPGLTIPGILWQSAGKPKAVVVLVSEKGKASAGKQFDADSLVKAGYAVLAIDVRGTGELKGLDQRAMMYLGTNDAFAQATDTLAACEAARAYSDKIIVVGSGPGGAQTAMFAALMDPKISYCVGLQGMHDYSEVFNHAQALQDTTEFSMQPRAKYGAPLEVLRSIIPCGSVWTFSGDEDPRLVDVLAKAVY